MSATEKELTEQFTRELVDLLVKYSVLIDETENYCRGDYGDEVACPGRMYFRPNGGERVYLDDISDVVNVKR